MEHDDVTEALAAHADRFSENGAQGLDAIELSAEQRQQLLPLLDLADRVRMALCPESAPAPFKRKLELDLMAVARQRRRDTVLMAGPPATHKWLIGAAVALVGGIAYLLHTRNRPGRSLATEPERRLA